MTSRHAPLRRRERERSGEVENERIKINGLRVAEAEAVTELCDKYCMLQKVPMFPRSH